MCPNRRWLNTGVALTVEVNIILTVTRRIKTVLWCFKTLAGTQKPFGEWFCGWPLLLHNAYVLRKTEVGLHVILCHSSTINSPSTDTRDVMISSLVNLVCVMW